MSALDVFRFELSKIGYQTIENDYVFSDVFSDNSPDRRVNIAAFTHSPPSYRNAALAVVEQPDNVDGPVADYRALGAPLLFVVDKTKVTIWEVGSQARLVLRDEKALSDVPELFNRNKDDWNPQRIHTAKSFGMLERSHQLDFVDLGLLPAIEGEIHKRVDRLLRESLFDTVGPHVVAPSGAFDNRLVFRTIFRLLAAKVLQDRGNNFADQWDADDTDAVLNGIKKLYRLPPIPNENDSFKGSVFDAAWQRLRAGINFRNISSEALAFVYENTLVTDEARQFYGVHNTPRQVAEYVVRSLSREFEDINNVRVYEPFAGAGAFMVAALQCMRDFLPVETSDQDRHDILVRRIHGDEINPFAAEVATLSLILADYPNKNGWKISETDLFQNYAITTRSKGATVVLCNPPFERFSPQERQRYPAAAARSVHKPIAAIEGVLDARPNAVGFVFPETFIRGSHYASLRSRIDSIYKDIEVVSLPDNIFNESVVRSSLLIAKDIREPGQGATTLRSTIILPRDREEFLASGEITETRTKLLDRRAHSDLWIPELDELWIALADSRRLSSVADVHRGLEWKDRQSEAMSLNSRPGWRLGLQAANSIRTYTIEEAPYLDCRPSRLRGGAIGLPWNSPKLLANSGRLSRGPWCFAAAIDRRGLVASQQLFGIWPTQGRRGPSLELLSAILNGPVAVAFVASHSRPDRIQVNTVENIPLPPQMPMEIEELVGRYSRIVSSQRTMILEKPTDQAAALLNDIDAIMLKSYDLNPRLERRLLEYFRGDSRPTAHEWSHWLPIDLRGNFPLHLYLSQEFKDAASGWVTRVFKPLPEDEADELREYLE